MNERDSVPADTESRCQKIFVAIELSKAKWIVAIRAPRATSKLEERVMLDTIIAAPQRFQPRTRKEAEADLETSLRLLRTLSLSG